MNVLYINSSRVFGDAGVSRDERLGLCGGVDLDSLEKLRRLGRTVEV
jgi:hypothetical protein